MIKKKTIASFLLILIINSLIVSAQSPDNTYILMKPLSWDELQLYQLDSLLTTKELHLSPHCPTTLNKLQDTYKKTSTHMQYILGTNYIWSEFSNDQGLKCLVKHDKIDSITPNNSVENNPNVYELLNVLQARILLSASIGGGNSEKELARTKRIMELNRINQAIQEKPYEKYGGIKNLTLYMMNNKPEGLNTKKALVQKVYRNEDGKITGAELFSRLEIFENEYSKEQQDELIESVKKNLKIKKK
jgi:hypothetical protein